MGQSIWQGPLIAELGPTVCTPMSYISSI
uniref:Uncharacterized protein n=1 Tax=Anguilla anguilla TaxID=7936 RepID=A0A0E9S1L8_ANGAN